ncbi:polysaccharide deacetylase [Natronolimnohabitans sp. A-GB9]|uniref:polysaccharide deacetylase family protein n=1 Tax=Natronolimnohabitans sp. A-GB9 TaxID=3069757 RepID=UPI0027AEC9B2|nr:polysaccharide deacetylase [Natronolimnohabitans sp. A-GB9]MDQ2049774.1 polysaccharide deacetylase [Natronolimnohabitans sp. A-GB9]
MEHELSRRHALGALAAGSTALAGCLGFLDDETDPDDGANGTAGRAGADSQWPAIGIGEVLSDFEELDRWRSYNGQIEAAPDEARTGSQAALLEGDEVEARMSLDVPEGLDLEGWDTSLAINPESATRIVVEFLAPTRDERLNTVRPIPDEYDGWFRLDCGYEHKPEGEPDLSNVTQLNVVAVGTEDEPPRVLVDDLRRTEAVDNGTAILAFYDGHDSHYEIAADRLEERGWTGAVPVDPGRVGSGDRMEFDELRELRDRGWDVCAYPRGEPDLVDQPERRQRTVVESVRDSLADQGFEDGSRHFFAPSWRQMTPTTHEIVREHHETGFLFGSCPVGTPPTGTHTIPVIWGPALHNGVRRHINLCDQYRQLTVIRIPPIVDEAEPEGSVMALEDFEHLLDHLEHRGLDVITPSDLVDGMEGANHGLPDGSGSKPDGVIFEAGEAHALEGTGETDTEPFDLAEGIVVGEFTHDGDAAFAASVVPTDGDRDDEALVTEADGDGESMLVVDAGTYRLEVDADGPWSVDLEQPAVHADDFEEPPLETSGTGSAFVGPLWTDDDLSLAVTHDGDGSFVVDGVGADGSWEQLVNQRGGFDASRSYAAAGVCWIDIEADGDWSLEIDGS